MEVRSIYKYARISPFAFTPKKAAFLINKTLKSAIANAENNANLKADGLVVKEAVVGEGPTFKRMMTRARGSGSRVLKRTSHIRIVLTDDVAIETRKTKKAKREQEKKTGEAAAKSTTSKKGKKKTAKAGKK